MNPLKRNNPLHLRFPHHEALSALLFYMSFWGFTTVSLYCDTTLRYDYKDIYHLLIRIGWLCVYLAVINVLFLSDYKIWHLLLFLCMGILLYISYKNSSYRWFFQSFLILLSAKHVKWNHLMKGCCAYYALLLLSIWLCCQTGLIYQMDFFRGNHLRTSIGFIQPNLFGAYLMVLALVWVAARYEALRIWDYLIILGIAIYVWIGPNSRTASVILLLLLLAIPIMKRFGNRMISNRFFQAIFLLIYPACFFISYIGAYYYDSERTIFVLLDKLLTGRISLAHAFTTNYSITWMGQKLHLVSSSQSALTGQPSSILDNAYMRLYINVGIVTTAIALIMLISIMWYAIRQNNQALILGLSLFAIYGLAEFRITKITANVFLIAFVYLFTPKEDGSIPKTAPLNRTA